MSIVPAAAQVLAVLRYLARQAAPVPAAAISRDVGLPRSTTYHLLDTLAADGFVVHLPEERRYALGVSAFELGSGYTRQAPFQRLARVPLARLVDGTGHNAHLAVLHGREVLYLIEERAPGRAPLVTEVGVRLPAQLTASGRAMLALLPTPQVRALFPDAAAFVQRTEVRGPGSLTALRTRLVEVRRRGYATEEGEVTLGFSSVAAAVTDRADHPVAGVAVTFESGALDADQREELAQAVTRTARELSRRVGGR
ncbi:IclR family transcriptional regulator [Streptacidiphilus anmyonensis]|uniref:IclR family transcriptional regulator n=1 Tax=Streptacidiphilus anmyonensis TaxID=405782 RepID=UPI0005A7325A|nr:IclR family transcriptional regulator [Streptacidiphilus anmyonensis]